MGENDGLLSSVIDIEWVLHNSTATHSPRPTESRPRASVDSEYSESPKSSPTSTAHTPVNTQPSYDPSGWDRVMWKAIEEDYYPNAPNGWSTQDSALHSRLKSKSVELKPANEPTASPVESVIDSDSRGKWSQEETLGALGRSPEREQGSYHSPGRNKKSAMGKHEKIACMSSCPSHMHIPNCAVGAAALCANELEDILEVVIAGSLGRNKKSAMQKRNGASRRSQMVMQLTSSATLTAMLSGKQTNSYEQTCENTVRCEGRVQPKYDPSGWDRVMKQHAAAEIRYDQALQTSRSRMAERPDKVDDKYALRLQEDTAQLSEVMQLSGDV